MLFLRHIMFVEILYISINLYNIIFLLHNQMIHFHFQIFLKLKYFLNDIKLMTFNFWNFIIIKLILLSFLPSNNIFLLVIKHCLKMMRIHLIFGFNYHIFKFNYFILLYFKENLLLYLKNLKL